MAKAAYKVPAPLDRSRLDMVIPIPIPILGTQVAWAVKSIMFWLGVIFGTAWVVLRSPLAQASWWVLFLVVLWIFAVAAFYGSRNKTGEMRFMQLPALISYFTPGRRQVMTRRNSNPYGFMTITQIKSIDDTGVIHYLDGSYGQLYSVVGAASRLLFESDRTRIVDRVDNFWRKAGTEAEWVWITTKEPQRVYDQIAEVERQNVALRHRDPDLDMLMREKLGILMEDVSGKYESIHQYLLLRSRTFGGLSRAHQELDGERRDSSLMLRKATILRREQALAVLGPIYGSPDRRRGGI